MKIISSKDFNNEINNNIFYENIYKNIKVAEYIKIEVNRNVIRTTLLVIDGESLS